MAGPRRPCTCFPLNPRWGTCKTNCQCKLNPKSRKGQALFLKMPVEGFPLPAITKLDVLDGFETLKICVAYRYQGRLLYEFPESLGVLEQCVPEYIEMPGWQEDISGIKRLKDLPANARSYLRKIEEITGVTVSYTHLWGKPVAPD